MARVVVVVTVVVDVGWVGRERRKGNVDYYAGQVVHRRAPLFFRLVRHEPGDGVSYINVGQVAR